ncbi:hypothetical protein [Gottfriedia luciferensis]|uniref:hypothetical protein n=1 Tax=Gottfriedia luciferensis TaxID=178774 RepID=UPI000B439870|nr:hypothetical protein [Gottfriedia luciferensis]
MTEIYKKDYYYVLRPFNYDFEEQVDFLQNILENDEVVLFGYKLYDFDLSNSDELLDENLKRYYESMIDLIDTTISSEELKEKNDKADFLNGKAEFLNEEWILDHTPKMRNEPLTTWVKPETKEEFIRALKITTIDHEFMCVFIKENHDFNTYRIGIKLVEGDESNELIIVENKNGTFLNDVLPRLKKIYKNIEIKEE